MSISFQFDFVSPSGQPPSPTLLNALHQSRPPASQQAGLGSLDWHSLRHTHGTLLHEQGTPLRVAQAQLGHSHMTTTLQIYTHASGNAQRHRPWISWNLYCSQMFPNLGKSANGPISEC